MSTSSNPHSTDSEKYLFIKTYGCQMNVYDSDRMIELLAPLSFKSVYTPDQANLIIINTCHIREKATEKVFSELGRLHRLKLKAKNEGRQLLLAVAGCVAQAEGNEIISRAPFVDMVFGPQTYHRLPQMIKQAEELNNTNQAGARIIDIDFDTEKKFDELPVEVTSRSSSFLTIQEGCDKFCSFCVVPYTRGAETSRSPEQVMREAKQMIQRGAKEIILLGQNVNAYHGTLNNRIECSLGRLIRELANLNGLDRIRYTTSHPNDMGDDLIDAHGDVPQLMPYLHLPVQTGSDRILRAMNRKHDVSSYLRVIDRLRNARNDIAFSSDFIVGHPGETDQDFAQTLKLISEVEYSQAYSFKYSARPGTPASTKKQIPEKTKSDRLQTLQQLLAAQQLAFNLRTVNSTQPVLVEKKGRKKGQLVGRSPFMQAVYFDGPENLIGQIQCIHIKEGFANSLAGKLVCREDKSPTSNKNETETLKGAHV
ncbi:MAG: tRNA (N6-isopentenyl adenosine(37)-C2)-methylthiotransferase MiaB [Rhodospirillaceae bacterium]|nr:tRNA (N6-isopentenyl adenosine(37)-C2)-methylthiotransferase MiaB [Rhodospirillaceae bacterium]|tara:strand:+ start:4547 stop:5989 length:1443 start_codon:yes stop_codon:yes gene_type:complete